MKKTVFILLFLLSALVAKAQFEQGKWIVNPSVTGLNLSYSSSEKTYFGVNGQAGVFLVDNAALMVSLGGEWNTNLDHYLVGVGGRYYFDSVGVYLGAGLNMNHYVYKEWDSTDYALGLEAGYAFFITRTVTIEPAVYYNLSFKDSDWSKIGLKVGFGFYF